jgi:putative endonuclease
MSNFARSVFYLGFTGCLEPRVHDHKNDRGSVFTRKYKCHYLGYYEEYNKPRLAINRDSSLNISKT